MYVCMYIPIINYIDLPGCAPCPPLRLLLPLQQWPVELPGVLFWKSAICKKWGAQWEEMNIEWDILGDFLRHDTNLTILFCKTWGSSYHQKMMYCKANSPSKKRFFTRGQ